MRFGRLFVSALLATVVAFGATAAAPDQAAASTASWTQFHYAATRAGYNPLETTIKASNVGKLKVAWKKALGDTVYSTPVVSGDRIFADGYYGKLYCLRLSDGKKLWTTTVGTNSDSTPAVWKNLVITPGWDSTGSFVAAYDVSSGSLKWRTRDVDQYSSVTPPAIFGNSVYVSAGTSIYALSASNGHILWSTQYAAPNEFAVISGPVAVSGYGEYVVGASGDGFVYALDAATGALHWKVKAGGGVYRGGPAIYSGIVYVPEGNFQAEGGGSNIVALQVSDGLILWRTHGGDDIHVTPAAGKGMVVVGSIDEGMVALNSQTGANLWTADYEGEVWGAPVIANGLVYDATEGSLIVYNAATGAKLYTLDMSNSMANMSSPSVLNGRVYAATGDGTIIVLRLQ